MFGSKEDESRISVKMERDFWIVGEEWEDITLYVFLELAFEFWPLVL